MKKSIIIVLLLTGIFTFSACNSNGNSNNAVTTTQDSTPKKDTINSNYNPATPAAQNGE